MEKFVIPVFVINLKREPKKRERISKRLEQLGVPFEVADAIDGQDPKNLELLKEVYDEAKSLQVIKRRMSKGEIGCALSHLEIYRRMCEKGIERAVILEDDAVLCGDFPKLLARLENLPDGCECLLLGYDNDIKREIFLYDSLWGGEHFFGKYRLKRYVKTALGAYGYMITEKGARKLMLENDKIFRPIDHYTGGHEFLNLFVLLPRCVRVDEQGLEESALDRERRELKRVLASDAYKTPIGRWLNRFRLGLRLYILKLLPLNLSRRWAAYIFKSRRRDG